MSGHLFAISIGPVQDFIAAARRTRDLWFGSYLLSELSRAVAKIVRKESDLLIFPTTQDTDDDKVAVANVVLAKLPVGADPKNLAKQSKKAVRERWKEFAWEAHKKISSAVVEDLWQSQVDDVIEFYAAWAPLNGEYKQARARVMRLLAGRKACRDFEQPKGDAEKRRRPKSSLDGRRETVLQKEISADVRAKLCLKGGEQLCAVALTKRLAGGTQRYPSVARIAADPWLRGVEKTGQSNSEVRQAFEALKAECDRLRFIHRLDDFDQYRVFPFEGTTVYESRYSDLADESGKDISDLHGLRNALHRLTKGKSDSGLGLGEPDPYLAVLVADGDRMGETISRIDEIENHRDLSARLAEFAGNVKRIVEDHCGVCVYAGGDDVLAVVPVDKALNCARKLHDDFQKRLEKFGGPTLSVGIAIGHFMEPLEDLRDYGQQAEKMAKRGTPGANGGLFGERNGLAVMIHPRGGVEFGIREQWGNGRNSLDQRLLELAQLFATKVLPGKLPYDLRQLAEQLRGWSAPAQAVQAEARLLLKRKQAQESAGTKLADRLNQCQTTQDLIRLAEEMLVSQWIASGLLQSRALTSAKRED